MSIVVNNELKMQAVIMEKTSCGKKMLIEAEIKEVEEEDNDFVSLIKGKVKEWKSEIITINGKCKKKHKKKGKDLDTQIGHMGICKGCGFSVFPNDLIVEEDGHLYHMCCFEKQEDGQIVNRDDQHYWDSRWW